MDVQGLVLLLLKVLGLIQEHLLSLVKLGRSGS